MVSKKDSTPRNSNLVHPPQSCSAIARAEPRTIGIQARWWICILTLLIVCQSEPLSAELAPATKRPNFLLIYTDDQSHRTVGCYEESPSWVKTPNLDRLAREGVRFRHAYAGPWCVPSRLMFLTGRHLHGVYNYPDTFPFWMESLRDAGYHTACIGKYHQYWHPPTDGVGRFWDHTALWKKNGPYYLRQNLAFDGGEPQPYHGYSTDNYTLFAEEYIRRDHDRPWFLWLCYDAVHSPYLAAGRHGDRYRNHETVEIPADIYPPRIGKPGYLRNMRWYWKPGTGPYAGVPVRTHEEFGREISEKWRGFHPESLPEMVRMYHRAVLAIDDGVGRIMGVLKETGQLDNTLVVFTSDQGFAFGQHGFETKIAPYDANMRVPLMVRMPGRVAQGTVCEHPVCQLDLVATFCALADAKPPFELHGHDLSPILKHPQGDWPHPVLLEHFAQRFGRATDRGLTGDDSLYGVPWWLLLRQGRYKYIRNLVENEIEELYDLEQDPQELHNLAVDPIYRRQLADFRNRLVKELERTKAGLVKKLPEPKITNGT